MSINKIGINLISILLALLMTLQSLVIPKQTAPAGSDTILLVSAQNSSGSPRSMQIVFSAPVRFTDDNPSAHIFASSSGTPDKDKNGWNVGLSDNENSCMPVDPTMAAGKVYASKYILTFKSDIAKTGVIRIAGVAAKGTNTKKLTGIPSICDSNGNTLHGDLQTSANGQISAVASYQIPIALIGTSVVSPTQAVLFFNYDVAFTAANPCDYITADNSQTSAPGTFSQQIKATACEKIDDKRYLVTFAGILPDSGEIKIQESKKNKNKSTSIVSSIDGSAKLPSSFTDSKGNSFAAAAFKNQYMQIAKTEYIDENTMRIYFPKTTKFVSSDPISAIMATNFGISGVSDSDLWAAPAISITPVDGTLVTGATVYDVKFEQKITADCNICISGKISADDYSLHSVKIR